MSEQAERVMGKGRLEAFSDGVFAIIITIMVLELKVPHGEDLSALRPLLPVFVSYILSFIYVGIYWNNHHHMMMTCKSVTGSILWANLHLLFWLSLVPFTTAWMGENHFGSGPSAIYGFVFIMAGLAYWILQRLVMAAQGPDSILRKAIGNDWKGKASPILYLIAVIASYWMPWISFSIYVGVAIMWIVPDRRIEIALKQKA